MKLETIFERSTLQVSPRLVVFALLSLVIHCQSVSAAETEPDKSIVEEESTLKTLRKKVRMRTFTEFMTPAIDNHQNYIPWEDGSALLPTNTFNIVWVDYEIAKDTKIVYHQRFNMNYAASPRGEGVHTVFRNPRIALRRMNVFNVPNLNTMYDVYIQPGLAPESELAGRNLEFGFRTNTSYSIPRSRFTIGAYSEFTTAICFNKPGPQGSSNAYGWLMPWASYDLNKTFSTQHYATVSFQHIRETQGIVHDYPMPLNVQNGIGINISENIWAALLLNNYLNTKPTLANTWASAWLVLSLL